MGLYLLAALAAVVVVLVLLLWRPAKTLWQDVQVEKARELFRLERERLEARFFDEAAGSGKPRGLRWKEIDWSDDVLFVRDRETGELLALVGITVYFEPIVGEALEDNPNATMPRDATAVFQFVRRHWATSGQVLFNMDPELVIQRYRGRFEPIGTHQRNHQSTA